MTLPRIGNPNNPPADHPRYSRLASRGLSFRRDFVVRIHHKLISSSLETCVTLRPFLMGLLTLISISLSHGGNALANPPQSEIEFNRDIRPILSENCFFCHGPDSGKREADLRLDLRDEAIANAITPGNSQASELVNRIDHDDKDLLMPPPTSGRMLTPQQKDLLRRWIDAGAEYQSHWSFETPQRPSLPDTPTSALPANQQALWSKNPIDRFLLDKMSQQGLTRQSPANLETLIRRVTFDLTGLPPTLQQIDEFVSDDSPDAFERLVDRLLASPRYGERMAADWLDVARYSDSYGMQVDRDRRVWPYRDWVISAFNSSMSYDRFITEQIAGDLLPGATQSQILATTFNRLHPQECEGGSVPEEFRIEYVADRTQTVATAFLGLTLECCRCHDHKYDPLSQREYFQLTSFFDKIDESGLYAFFTDACPTPTLALPTEAQQQSYQDAAAKVERLEQKERTFQTTQREPFSSWLHQQTVPKSGETANSPSGSDPLGIVAHLDFEKPAPKGTTAIPGVSGQAIRIGGDDEVPVGTGNFNRWQPFTISHWLNVPNHKDRAVVFHRSRAWTDAASRGYELLIEDGRLQASLIHFWPGNQVAIRAIDPLPLNTWKHIAVTWDGSSRASGLAIFVDGKQVETEIVRDALTKNITGGGGDEIAIGARFRDRGLKDGAVDEFKVFNRQLTPIEIAELHRPGTIAESIASAAEANTDKGLTDAPAELFDYYLATVDADYKSHLEELQAARQSAFAIADSFTEIMVMREMQSPRKTYLLNRGAYDAPTDPVESATPQSLLPWDESLPKNRLGLTQWLCDPRHPLTSRVAVNRLWQTIFGRGLVSTPEDFGSQGSLPSHPELLDWLAVEFVESGWDVKAMVRLMVTTAAYQQQSTGNEDRDPENVFLSRSPSYRLSAEMLRDNVLYISGLMSGTVGGEPARPYEVESSFKPVSRDKGAGLHRRSLYTYWNRTGPAPALTTLDASLRDVCRMKREVTATPLQSLVILNSPQFTEAARELAQQVIRSHGDDVLAAIKDLFRITTSRQATDAEIDLLKELFDKQSARFSQSPDQANQWLSVGDTPPDKSLDPTIVAAMASVANMLFNYDGCVTKR